MADVHISRRTIEQMAKQGRSGFPSEAAYDRNWAHLTICTEKWGEENESCKESFDRLEAAKAVFSAPQHAVAKPQRKKFLGFI